MSEALAQYLSDISKFPLLNKEQEILLARQLQASLQEGASKAQKRAGHRAYTKLINCNLRLVVSIVKRFRNRASKAEMLDLIQEGNIGLSHGVTKFDPERGYAMSTYIYWWIRQGITRYLGCSDRIIRLPSHAGETLAKLRSWTPQFFIIHGREPTPQESADFCRISLEKMELYLSHVRDAASLDVKVTQADGKGDAIINLMPSNENLLDQVENQLKLEAIDTLMEGLKPDDKELVLRYHGLLGQPAVTLTALAKERGITRERVRQRISRSMRKLKVHALHHLLIS